MNFCTHELRAAWRLIVSGDFASACKLVERLIGLKQRTGSTASVYCLAPVHQAEVLSGAAGVRMLLQRRAACAAVRI